MPGCSHPCRLCAGYTDTGAHIHPQWSNTWMSARTYVHNTHAHTGIHTRFEMHTSKVNLPVRREAEWRYIIIHPVCLVFFFEKKKGRKTNLFTKFDTNLYPSPFFFFFFASQWFQVNHFVLTHPVTKSTSNVNRMRVPIEAQQHAMLFAIRKPRGQDDRSCRQYSFVSCVDLCCVSNMQYYSSRKFHSFFLFFFFAFSVHLSFGFFQASFSCFFFFFFFFLSLIIDGRLPFLLGVKMTHYPGSILH